MRPHEAAWALAFLMFAVAATSQVIGDLVGWTSSLARPYYVIGATLVVGWLGRVPTRLRKPLGKIALPHLRKV